MFRALVKLLFLATFIVQIVGSVSASTRVEVDLMIDEYTSFFMNELEYLDAYETDEQRELIAQIVEVYRFGNQYENKVGEKAYCENILTGVEETVRTLGYQLEESIVYSLDSKLAIWESRHENGKFDPSMARLVLFVADLTKTVYLRSIDNFCRRYYDDNYFGDGRKHIKLDLASTNWSELLEYFEVIEVTAAADTLEIMIREGHESEKIISVSPNILKFLNIGHFEPYFSDWESYLDEIISEASSLEFNFIPLKRDIFVIEGVEQLEVKNSIIESFKVIEIQQSLQEIDFENVNFRGGRIIFSKLDFDNISFDKVSMGLLRLDSSKFENIRIKNSKFNIEIENNTEIRTIELSSSIDSKMSRLKIGDSRVYSLKLDEAKIDFVLLNKAEVQNFSSTKSVIGNTLDLSDTVIEKMKISGGNVGIFNTYNSKIENLFLGNEIEISNQIQFKLTNIGVLAMNCENVKEFWIIQSDLAKIWIDDCTIDSFKLTDTIVDNNITLQNVVLKNVEVNRLNALNFTMLGGSFGNVMEEIRKTFLFRGMKIIGRMQFEDVDLYNGFLQFETIDVNDFVFNNNVFHNATLMLSAGNVNNLIDIGKNKCQKYLDIDDKQKKLNGGNYTNECAENDNLTIEFIHFGRMFLGNNVLNKLKIVEATTNDITFETYDKNTKNNHFKSVEFNIVTVANNLGIYHLRVDESLVAKNLTVKGNFSLAGANKINSKNLEFKGLTVFGNLHLNDIANTDKISFDELNVHGNMKLDGIGKIKTKMLHIEDATVGNGLSIGNVEVEQSLFIDNLNVKSGIRIGAMKLANDEFSQMATREFKLGDSASMILSNIQASKITMKKELLCVAIGRIELENIAATFEIIDDELKVITDAGEIHELLINDYSANLYNSMAEDFEKSGMVEEYKNLKIEQNTHFAKSNALWNVKILYFLGEHINSFGYDNGRAIVIYLSFWVFGALFFWFWAMGWLSELIYWGAVRLFKADVEDSNGRRLQALGGRDLKDKTWCGKLLYSFWFSTDRSLPPLYLDSLFDTHVRLPSYLAHWFYFQRVASFIVFLFFLASSFGLYQ